MLAIVSVGVLAHVGMLHTGKLINRSVGGQVEVGAGTAKIKEFAGVCERWAGNTHVNLLNASSMKIANVILELRAAYNRIVEKNAPFPSD